MRRQVFLGKTGRTGQEEELQEAVNGREQRERVVGRKMEQKCMAWRNCK